MENSSHAASFAGASHGAGDPGVGGNRYETGETLGAVIEGERMGTHAVTDGNLRQVLKALTDPRSHRRHVLHHPVAHAQLGMILGLAGAARSTEVIGRHRVASSGKVLRQTTVETLGGGGGRMNG